MKKVWRRNQLIITALVILVGVAGYLNFTEKSVAETLDWVASEDVETTASVEDVETLNKEVEEDLSEELETEGVKEIEATKSAKMEEATEGELTEEELAEVETTSESEDEKVGEAVLTNAKTSDVFYSIKLEREQTRAQNKEMLTEILNNTNATENQKNDAINSIMEMADIAEKENAAETLLTAKGFSGAVVSITDDSADVVINQGDLTDQEVVQIDDIVSRKTGISMENIVISTNE